MICAHDRHHRRTEAAPAKKFKRTTVNGKFVTFGAYCRISVPTANINTSATNPKLSNPILSQASTVLDFSSESCGD